MWSALFPATLPILFHTITNTRAAVPRNHGVQNTDLRTNRDASLTFSPRFTPRNPQSSPAADHINRLLARSTNTTSIRPVAKDLSFLIPGPAHLALLKEVYSDIRDTVARIARPLAYPLQLTFSIGGIAVHLVLLREEAMQVGVQHMFHVLFSVFFPLTWVALYLGLELIAYFTGVIKNGI